MSTNREKGATIYESLSDYVVIDLETTDVYVTTCSVIELSAIRVRNNEICETFSTLVNPEEKIPEEVTQQQERPEPQSTEMPAARHRMHGL